MTKEQYLRTIETVIKSPRNDLQKIIILKYAFELYVEENEDEQVFQNYIFKWGIYCCVK